MVGVVMVGVLTSCIGQMASMVCRVFVDVAAAAEIPFSRRASCRARGRPRPFARITTRRCVQTRLLSWTHEAMGTRVVWCCTPMYSVAVAVAVAVAVGRLAGEGAAVAPGAFEEGGRGGCE